MIRFFKSLTATVLLSFLLITVLDPILRQRMLEGENVFVSFKVRLEDFFSYPNSEDAIPPEVIVNPDYNEKDNETIEKEDKDETNDEITSNPEIDEEIKTPSEEEKEENKDTVQEEKPSTGNKPTGTIKPFPSKDKEEEDVEEPPVEEVKPQEPEVIQKNPNFTPVYYNQSKEEIGYSQGCLLTSYAMVITNAGRYTGNKKEYNPIDLYLANNPTVTAANQRRIIAYHLVIADAFNYTWTSYSLSGKSDSSKINKVTSLLTNNPWGVIIGGSYGNGNTHYVAVRLVNGKLVFDDPVKSRGGNLQTISRVWGIDSWSKITSVTTITPNLDKYGKWADGVYEIKKKNPNKYHICQTQMYC